MVKIKNKKTTKVKKKVVRCKKKVKKKKTVKKKAKKRAVKKRTVKKKTKKILSKKKVVKKKVVKKRYRKRKKIFMQDIYSIINKVQFGKKKITFTTELEDGPVIENNIKDVNLEYDKVDMKTQVVFTLYPNDTEYEDEGVLSLDIMDDEIPDLDEIFG